MIRAVIFDFNGIIVDDEPVHFELFRRVLKEEGIDLSKKDYYAKYLGMDDRGCFTAAHHDNGKYIKDKQLARLIARKALYYQEAIQNNIRPFPGVTALVAELAERFSLAVASGALRNEIEQILSTIGIRQYFRVIVSAEDVTRGKPDPEIFLKALAQLNETYFAGNPVRPAECLVIEDSKEGIRGARQAGMKCLAVSNSHPAEQLHEADAVTDSLEQINPNFLETVGV
jgi:beta-phosphoglucomutase